MNLHNLEEIVLIFLLSMVKFGFGGVPLAVLGLKFPFFKAMTITSAGGVTSAIIFANLSEWVLDKWHHFRVKFFPYKEHKRSSLLNSKLGNKITTKWGLIGLAIFTPFILSIPVGTLLAVHFYHDKQKVIAYMLISIIAWGVLFCLFYNSMSPSVANYFSHH
jgi:hypothetical protein